MKRAVIRTGIAAALAATTLTATAGRFVGSSHDFSIGQLPGLREKCVVCHIPNRVNPIVPLWTSIGAATPAYPVYANGETPQAIQQPGMVSKVCLSCHDGALATDAFSNRSAASGTNSFFSRDLAHGHPIGLPYGASAAMVDPSVFDPTVRLVTIGTGDHVKSGSVLKMMLVDGFVECSSCHDPHNNYTVPAPLGAASNKLLKIQIFGSKICIACHDK